MPDLLTSQYARLTVAYIIGYECKSPGAEKQLWSPIESQLEWNAVITRLPHETQHQLFDLRSWSAWPLTTRQSSKDGHAEDASSRICAFQTSVKTFWCGGMLDKINAWVLNVTDGMQDNNPSHFKFQSSFVSFPLKINSGGKSHIFVGFLIVYEPWNFDFWCFWSILDPKPFFQNISAGRAVK